MCHHTTDHTLACSLADHNVRGAEYRLRPLPHRRVRRCRYARRDEFSTRILVHTAWNLDETIQLFQVYTQTCA